MKKTLIVLLFMLATFAWAAAQDAGNMGQAAPPSSQAPGAGQAQPGMPHAGDPGEQPGTAGQTLSSTVTEGCLGGSAPNFTITDKAGTTYKLNLPGGNVSALSAHVGEPVRVQGDVTGGKTSSIDVQRIGAGSGTCPGSGATSAQPPTK
jgi:uncharacterized protein YdeI (BOF family)